jgi:hypothetical protein
MTLRGTVTNGVVVFESGTSLPNGTQVEVTPTNGTPNAPAGPPYPVTEERRKALLALTGMWKTDNPPDDAEVERIIDDYRMKKYG